SVRGAHVRVHVCAAADARCDVVNVEVHVLINDRLQAKRSDYWGAVVSLREGDKSFGHYIDSLKQRLSERRVRVADDSHQRVAVFCRQLQGLLGGDSHQSVKVAFESKINAEELDLLVDRRIEEVEVEHGADDVLFDPRVVEGFGSNNLPVDEPPNLRVELLRRSGGEEPTFERHILVVKLHHHERVDVIFARIVFWDWNACLLTDPIVILFFSLPILYLQHLTRAYERQPKLVFDSTYTAVDYKRTVRDE